MPPWLRRISALPAFSAVSRPARAHRPSSPLDCRFLASAAGDWRSWLLGGCILQNIAKRGVSKKRTLATFGRRGRKRGAACQGQRGVPLGKSLALPDGRRAVGRYPSDTAVRRYGSRRFARDAACYTAVSPRANGIGRRRASERRACL